MSAAKNPRILLTNDDGINAEGLEVLERIAKNLSNDLWTVAPEQEQSGAAHSLTLHSPVRIRNINAKRFAVTGTPTDCVLIAKQALMQKHKPDLVLSGVNRGSNVGDDITYSGTVAGAIEGALLGFRSIALSQLFTDGKPIRWETAEKYAPQIIKKILTTTWIPGTLINLNFPDCAPSKVKGIVCPPQGKRVMSVGLHARIDPKKRPYYWIGGERENTAEKDTDVALLDQGYITVTPLTLDMTDYRALADLKKTLGV